MASTKDRSLILGGRQGSPQPNLDLVSGTLLRATRGARNKVPEPQNRKKNCQISKYRVENRRNTDTAIMIGHAYLKL